MLAEDQFKRIRPIRWKKDQRPQYRLVIEGVAREDERTFRQTAKKMGCSVSVFYAVLARALRDGRVVMLPDGTDIDGIIREQLVTRIDATVEERVRAIMADANMGDEYMR